MKTIFDNTTRAELIQRINTLNENSNAQWGKMNVSQMLKHCIKFEEMILGKQIYKQSFIGKIFGKTGLKNFLKNEDPMGKNLPTVPGFKIIDTGDIVSEKAKWIALIEEEAHNSNKEIVHPFFGNVTREQIGQLAYKHTDHHLRQFNC